MRVADGVIEHEARAVSINFSHAFHFKDCSTRMTHSAEEISTSCLCCCLIMPVLRNYVLHVLVLCVLCDVSDWVANPGEAYITW